MNFATKLVSLFNILLVIDLLDVNSVNILIITQEEIILIHPDNELFLILVGQMKKVYTEFLFTPPLLTMILNFNPPTEDCPHPLCSIKLWRCFMKSSIVSLIIKLLSYTERPLI